MIDGALRTTKDRLVGPIARRVAGRVGPGWITTLSIAGGVSGGVAAGFGLRWQAVVLWLLGRAFDGLDGAVARDGDRQSDLGGYLDMMADTIGYAAVPIGIAAAQGDIGVWTWCAVLLATFYANTMSWTYLAAIAEKRGIGARETGESTTVHMPTGLVEGAETIVLFVLMLALPDKVSWLFPTMAALVGVTVVQRGVWAARNLSMTDTAASAVGVTSAVRAPHASSPRESSDVDASADDLHQRNDPSRRARSHAVGRGRHVEPVGIWSEAK